jgi:GntR family uxuAB operon transcriptional repressor
LVSTELPGEPAAAPPNDLADQRLVVFLSDAIATGRYASGARLPTERGLAASLAIPRTAVRRGLAVLEAQGRITRHVGRGTFVVGEVSAEASTPIGRATSPAEIMDVRLMLEPQIAALAADCATSPELERIGHCLAQAEAASSTEAFEKWDGALHHAIAAATHNAFLLRIFNFVHAVRDEPLWGSLKRRSFTPARRRDYQRDHRRIVEALAQRDGEAARRFMREHILRVRGNLLNRE